MDSIETSVEVVETELQGLEALRNAIRRGEGQIDSAIKRAVDLCRGVKGRVIVTGMGKSGHVARKIAATMASTGTPASYVHPGEASHGDLGMISEQDVVIALSNSGETPELGDILSYTQRFDIPLIAMTSGATSSLARASSALLLIPKAKEACGITKAPTTSTTLMMALGDALAVAILRAKGFSATDFHKFHPGGKLGAALKPVTDLMHHTSMPLCAATDAATEVVKHITEGGFGCAGIIDPSGALVGIVTDGDIRRNFAKITHDVKASEIMTHSPRTITEDSLAAEALSILSQSKITALFIVDEHSVPKGLLHVHDCLSVGVI